jgi:hypothetical protein
VYPKLTFRASCGVMVRGGRIWIAVCAARGTGATSSGSVMFVSCDSSINSESWVVSKEESGDIDRLGWARFDYTYVSISFNFPSTLEITYHGFFLGVYLYTYVQITSLHRTRDSVDVLLLYHNVFVCQDLNSDLLPW